MDGRQNRRNKAALSNFEQVLSFKTFSRGASNFVIVTKIAYSHAFTSLDTKITLYFLHLHVYRTKSYKICYVFVLQIPGRLYPIEVRYQPPKVEVSRMDCIVGYTISLAIITERHTVVDTCRSKVVGALGHVSW